MTEFQELLWWVWTKKHVSMKYIIIMKNLHEGIVTNVRIVEVQFIVFLLQ